ncbi:LacI family DNA-binding transcriptional regulator, partial [Janthinobacterium sp.]|uniref:LacI family DNA-binding transcriptional regulator n=1 Tax=Janthinobacterium sp. TaxID=1871054 RepID=UPI00293D5C45
MILALLQEGESLDALKKALITFFIVCLIRLHEGMKAHIVPAMNQPKKNIRPTPVTMAEVAAKAGVSPTTVARALYSNGYISDENRKLVEAAVAATGYRPNVMARALRTKRSSTIGMVLSEANRNPFYTAIAHAVQIEAMHQGYTILSFNHNFSEQAERAGVQRFLDQHVDAVIYCHAYAPADIKSVRDAKVPIVQIEREIIKGGHRCLVDPAPGMSAAVARLKHAGHIHIGFIGGKPGGLDWEIAVEETVEAKRVEAFKNALHAEGLSVDKASMVFSPYYS